ncbi:HyaD/HybD family hydrogenase maturation endopeptidase [Campylobacter corcagiensis]|uniref:HyaD/HybD family hydrogenase maturation endopeptidase n=1 Tax=Campylobacter corcagiensis TaxID=1448857 RepID=A0A7M1LEV2_9BACT|nr:HyaD/HybD family hydrogenase maturation endopeptidase [Campylobacter corcagiensis]QKF64739.1 [Ni-Fe] hydrogenase maturation protease [Campylobacter corcagiensis]QOQ87097.1 HyaD/HybD family hydrogenase maturation endopeptidase [Campylobacter corcagiensis]
MKVLILGIGNVLFGDEGVGVHFANYLKLNYKFYSKEHELEFVDGGTLAMALTPIISSFDKVLMIDCIDADDANVGDVYYFNYLDMPNRIKWSGSAHEVEMLQTLNSMEFLGDLPDTQILGIVPKRIEPMTFKQSLEILNAVPKLEITALKFLENLGFSYEKVGNITLQDIAFKHEKGEL